MAGSTNAEYFERARSIASAFIFVAGALTILGTALDWVSFSRCPRFDERADFGDADVERVQICERFTGLETGEGPVLIAAGAGLIACSFLLVLKQRSGYAWLAFLASVVVGSIAIADYRGIGDLSSSISRRMEIVGEARPAVGITLVAAAALAGLISSIAGIAATPRTD